MIIYQKKSTVDSRQSTKKRGFTLIELLVVMAIFIVITAAVLARQNRFSSDILLTDLAYQVAISIRQAQVYGLSVRAEQNNNFDIGYGIHFDVKYPSTYLLFVDNGKDGIYGDVVAAGANPDRILNTYQIEKGDKISNVCAWKDKDLFCFSSKTLPKSSLFSTLDIVYIRPNPEANIHSDGKTDSDHTYDRAIITIVSALGNRFKCVDVDQNGQVSVYNPADPNNQNPCS